MRPRRSPAESSNPPRRRSFADASSTPPAPRSLGAHVTVTPDRSRTPASAVTNQQGEFEIPVGPGRLHRSRERERFPRRLPSRHAEPGSATAADFTLEVAGIQESVSVGAAIGYSVPAVSSATKTTTPLRDVPASRQRRLGALIADQRMSSMADVTRYMPGVGFAQGEGNRDTPILRGNSSTSDFFVDGVRDDVQYFRDVYNVERVEALKGPNAMIFGRGGVGGVINRVTRQADWGPAREASLQFGSWDNRRFTADVGRGLNETVALRATGVYENSDSYRDGVGLDRYGFNPTVAVRRRTRTRRSAPAMSTSTTSGSPTAASRRSTDGRWKPLPARSSATRRRVRPMRRSTSSPRCSSTGSTRGVTLRNRLSYGDYDKFYQNVFPGAVNAGGHDGRHLRLQQRHDPPESVQPDRPDRLGADRAVRPHAARRHRVRPAGDGQLSADRILLDASAPT